MIINTHIKVICAWVINHLNEIDYIWMVQHFHDQNLQEGYEYITFIKLEPVDDIKKCDSSNKQIKTPF